MNCYTTSKSTSTSSSAYTPGGMMFAYYIPKSGEKGKICRIEIPTPPQDYALIKVLYAGVCNTDLEITRGYMDFTGVIGHEFVGKVINANTTNTTLKSKFVNQFVCGDINLPCASIDCNICNNSHALALRDNPCQFQRHCRCYYLRRNHCPNRKVLGILNHNGTFSEYITLPIGNLHLVPKALFTKDGNYYNSEDGNEVNTCPTTQMEKALKKCVFSEPLAAAFRIVEQNVISYGCSSHPTPDKVAILGDGKLGLLIAEVLGREHLKRFGLGVKVVGNHTTGSGTPQPPTLFGKHKDKMALVNNGSIPLETVCVDDIFQQGCGAMAKVQHVKQYDVVIDATGNPNGLLLASQLCCPMGKIILKSTCAVGERFNTAPFVIDELSVIGSRCGPVEVALELLTSSVKSEVDEDGAENDEGDCDGLVLPAIDVEKYITKVFPLKDAEEAIAFAEKNSSMKVLIDCNVPSSM